MRIKFFFCGGVKSHRFITAADVDDALVVYCCPSHDDEEGDED
jgi:hypothetical protein